jgi:hypothetical protein
VGVDVGGVSSSAPRSSSVVLASASGRDERRFDEEGEHEREAEREEMGECAREAGSSSDSRSRNVGSFWCVRQWW